MAPSARWNENVRTSREFSNSPVKERVRLSFWAKRGQEYVSKTRWFYVEARVRRLRLCVTPHRLLRVISNETRGENPVVPAGASKHVRHPPIRPNSAPNPTAT